MMSDSLVAFIALGSNVGDRIMQLREAVRRLSEHPDVDLFDASPVYESAAQTLEQSEVQPPYLNAVIKLVTTLTPRELLAFCLEIERSSGRERAPGRRWQPRTLDLDILLLGSHSIDDDDITLPHPRMSERMFVLRPLVDIAPDVVVPAPYDALASELLNTCTDTSALRVTPHILIDDRDPERSA